ncbi:hypothetical protein Gotur_014660 [Gossypium turneri]
MLNEESWIPKDELWKKAWKLLGPQKVHFFFWTVFKQRLLTNMERVRRGLAEDPSCPICGHSSKDILHVIRDCTLAKQVWKQNRNLFIFQEKSWSPEEIIKTSASWAKHFSLASRQVADIEIEMTYGEPLAREWTYLNTDSVVRVDSEDAAAG